MIELTEDLSPRRYPLPHPDHIAIEDASSIREAIFRIDADVSEQESEYRQLRERLERDLFEREICLWNPL